jgi:hypothetical protein
VVPARRALAAIVQPPRLSAATAVVTQVASHSRLPDERGASAEAARASTPIPTPPHPGTAVKAVARSIVRRMKERLSIARM